MLKQVLDRPGEAIPVERVGVLIAGDETLAVPSDEPAVGVVPPTGADADDLARLDLAEGLAVD